MKHTTLLEIPAKKRRFLFLLRIIAAVLIVLAMPRQLLYWNIPGREAPYVIVLLDQSLDASTPQAQKLKDKWLKEIVAEAGDDDEVLVVPYAGEVGEPLWYEDWIEEDAKRLDKKSLGASNLEAAIRRATLEIDDSYTVRFEFITTETETTGRANSALAGLLTHYPCNFRTLPTPTSEVCISQVTVPPSAPDNQPFTLVAQVAWNDTTGAKSNPTTLTLLRNGKKFATKKVTLEPGLNMIPFDVRTPRSPMGIFTLRAKSSKDFYSLNNASTATVRRSIAPKVLLVNPDPELAKRLSTSITASIIDVSTVAADAFPKDFDQLNAYDLVLLSNVSAEALGDEGAKLLQRYVEQAGGGLVVLGGDQAFTPGGYQESILENILPVKSTIRDIEPPVFAMSLVLDKSRSMEAGGRDKLAKAGVKEAIGVITERDKMGVIAFADTSEWAVPFGQVPNEAGKETLKKKIDAIQLLGGGTNMYPALEKAFLALVETEADIRHIILLSDGLSHPGDFDALAKEMKDQGVTVSTIALGDAAAGGILRDIAKTTGGSYHQPSSPSDLPAIFRLETKEGGKRGITEGKPFQPKLSPSKKLEAPDVVTDTRWFRDVDFKTMPPLFGFADTQLKEGGELLLATEDADPLLAFWQSGPAKGKVAVFTSNVQPRWAKSWYQWEGFHLFWEELVRKTMRKHTLFNVALDLTEKDYLVVTYEAKELAEQFEVPFSEVVVSASYQSPGAKETIAAKVQQVAPDLFAVKIPRQGLGDYQFSLSVQKKGTTQTLFSQDWTFPLSYPLEVTHNAKLGKVTKPAKSAPASLYSMQPRLSFFPFAGWIVVVAMFIIFVEIFFRRHGAGTTVEEEPPVKDQFTTFT